MSALERQQALDQQWTNLSQVVRQSIVGWTFTTVMCALQQLQNQGLYMSYKVLQETEHWFRIRFDPFRGYPKTLDFDLVQGTVWEFGG